MGDAQVGLTGAPVFDVLAAEAMVRANRRCLDEAAVNDTDPLRRVSLALHGCLQPAGGRCIYMTKTLTPESDPVSD